jgi:hypothetical protein
MIHATTIKGGYSDLPGQAEEVLMRAGGRAMALQTIRFGQVLATSAVCVFVSGTPAPESSGTTTPPTVDAGSGRRRVFLIVFGVGRIEGPVHPFDGAIEFLRERSWSISLY